LLEKADLPEDAGYYLPGPGWITPHLNEEVIYGWGTTEGKEYLDKTGRITGWVVYYKRGSITAIAPEEISQNIVQYETTRGALISLNEYPITKVSDWDWKKLNREINIGGESNFFLHKEMKSNGRYWVWYRVDTAFRNYYSSVRGIGWEEDVVYEYVDEIARTAIEKLEAAPLEIPD